MPRTYEYEDPYRLKLIENLEEASRGNNAKIWKAIAGDLSRSSRNRCTVNIWSINKHTSEGDTIVVPGKLLSEGVLDHKVEVAAFKVTESAKKKVEMAGGKIITIPDLIKKNPRGSGIKIIG